MTHKIFINFFAIVIFSVLSCLYFGSYAKAANALKIISVSGASGYDAGTGTASPTIYGGITGDIVDCQNAYGESTACNNCIPSQPAGSEKACNTSRIHNSLVLRIEFEVVADITGPISFGHNTGGATSFSSGSFTPSPTTSLSKGSTGSVEITWGTLCGLFLASADSSCPAAPGTNTNVTLYISLDSSYDTTKRIEINLNFLDPNATTTSDLLGCATTGLSPTAPDDGICRFNAKPGDGKVYVDDNITIPNCTVKFKYARFFYSNISVGDSFIDASYGSSNYVDLPFDSNCTPDGDWVIDGLTNGQVYAFRSSMVDLANNNVFLNTYDTVVTGGPEGILGAQPSCNDADLAAVAELPGDTGFDADTDCTFAARPGQVEGLLPEDFNCFIATAAYGTGFEPKVFTLRKFRNHFLLRNSIGKSIIKTYYKYGPAAARYIADKPLLRSLTRGALWPVWGLAWLSLQYGLLFGLSAALLGLAVTASLFFAFAHFLKILKKKFFRTKMSTFTLFSLVVLMNIPSNDSMAQSIAKPQSTAQPPMQPALVQPPDILLDDQTPVVDATDTVPHIKKKRGSYDATFKPENRLIEHPNASKGLIKIDKNRVYQYKVKTTDQSGVGNFHLGLYEPLDLVNPNDSSLSFDELYDETDFPLILYDHEIQFWRKFGRLGWTLGGGFYFAQGNGRFVELNPDPDPPSESFTLLVLPLNAGLIYRFQYHDYQRAVPYVAGGGDIFAFAETRDDNNNPTLGAALGAALAAHGSVGLSILLGRNSGSFLDLDREYGINTIYLTAEFRRYIGLSSKFDFTGNAITGGISAEY